MPKQKPLYCVYHNRIADYLSSDLTYALRWIANKLDKRLCNCTVLEAINAGYTIQKV